MFESLAGPDLGPALAGFDVRAADGEALVEALAASQRAVSWLQALQAELVAEVVAREPAVSASFAGDPFDVAAARGRRGVDVVGAGRARPASTPAWRSPTARRCWRRCATGRLDWVRAEAVASAVGALAARPGMAARGRRGGGGTRWSGRAGRPRRRSARALARLVLKADPAGGGRPPRRRPAGSGSCGSTRARTGWPSCGRCSPPRTRCASTPRSARPAGRRAAPSATHRRRRTPGPRRPGSRPSTTGRCRPWTSAAPTPSSTCSAGRAAASSGGGRGAGPAGAGVASRPGGARPPAAPTAAARPGGPVPRGERPQILVTVPAGTLLGLGGEPAHLAGYGPIPDSLARELAQDGVWRRVLDRPRVGRGPRRRPQPARPARRPGAVRADPRRHVPVPRLPQAGRRLRPRPHRPVPRGGDVRGEPARPVPPRTTASSTRPAGRSPPCPAAGWSGPAPSAPPTPPTRPHPATRPAPSTARRPVGARRRRQGLRPGRGVARRPRPRRCPRPVADDPDAARRLARLG